MNMVLWEALSGLDLRRIILAWLNRRHCVYDNICSWRNNKGLHWFLVEVKSFFEFDLIKVEILFFKIHLIYPKRFWSCICVYNVSEKKWNLGHSLILENAITTWLKKNDQFQIIKSEVLWIKRWTYRDQNRKRSQPSLTLETIL
jgi:hypothetical protein